MGLRGFNIGMNTFFGRLMGNLQEKIIFTTYTRTDLLSRRLDQAATSHCLILPSELSTYDVAEK